MIIFSIRIFMIFLRVFFFFLSFSFFLNLFLGFLFYLLFGFFLSIFSLRSIMCSLIKQTLSYKSKIFYLQVIIYFLYFFLALRFLRWLSLIIKFISFDLLNLIPLLPLAIPLGHVELPVKAFKVLDVLKVPLQLLEHVLEPSGNERFRRGGLHQRVGFFHCRDGRAFCFELLLLSAVFFNDPREARDEHLFEEVEHVLAKWVVFFAVVLEAVSPAVLDRVLVLLLFPVALAQDIEDPAAD
mmetsp:Transcript_42357/g.49361  ORF Transcript_42357/g.49361 Transcript_42357/m.49361 type:complete len:240 (-) Transcript_42357:817-1536(-)